MGDVGRSSRIITDLLLLHLHSWTAFNGQGANWQAACETGFEQYIHTAVYMHWQAVSRINNKGLNHGMGMTVLAITVLFCRRIKYTEIEV